MFSLLCSRTGSGAGSCGRVGLDMAQGWGYYGGWQGPNWKVTKEPMVELLPDYVQGWYLLADASLDRGISP